MNHPGRDSPYNNALVLRHESAKLTRQRSVNE